MQQETQAVESDGLSIQQAAPPPTLLCHGQGSWELGFGRTQHLLSRLASHRRVFFVEAAVPDDSGPRLRARTAEGGVVVVTPCLPQEQLERAPVRRAVMRQLLSHLVVTAGIEGNHIAWYDGPLPLGDSDHLRPRLMVYDCADEPGRPAGAAADVDIGAREAELLARADLVLTGGQSLYEARCLRHPRVFCLPSAVDVSHFHRARSPQPVPADQAGIAPPRLGFAGVIDDRLDVGLLAQLAAARPDWQIVLAGPVLKIDPARLPRAANIHYLGGKSYQQLPSYLAGWDVALMPLVRSDATRFLGPGRVFEYLAAGRHVVATGVRDLRPLAQQGLVQIADSSAELVAAVQAVHGRDLGALRLRADRVLGRCSWEGTTRRIAALLREQLPGRSSSVNRQPRASFGARSPGRAAV